MIRTLAHRGPDGEGVWADENIALGHRRLAILDISEAGAQPMSSADGRFIVVLNGEIYNHADLRRELASQDAAPRWRGHSDTETLIASFVHWGLEETLRRAIGMFALALWDKRDRKLFLARDRIGEKPLYWGWIGQSLVFASELKALRAHPDCPTEICREALSAYLGLGYVPAPLTIHPGLYKLEPGCILEVAANSIPPAPPQSPLRAGDRHGSLSIRSYWTIASAIENGERDPITSEAQAITETETALTKSVQRQLLSDVPLGAFLSGGIDSSLIVSLMQKQSTRPVQTFTVGFEAREYDESPFAAEVARHLRTDHAALFVTDAEARATIPLLPNLYDEPFADSSQIPTYLVCKAARSSITVALSGDGGDELFGGYNRYSQAPHTWARMARVPFGVRRMFGAAALAVPPYAWDLLGDILHRMRGTRQHAMPLGRKIHRISKRLCMVNSLEALHFDTTSIWTDAADLMVDDVAIRTPSELHFTLPSSMSGDPAGKMMALDLAGYLPDDILCKVDRAAMGSSLETRAPFLDPTVVALSTRLPANMKIRSGQGKWVLRQVLDRHVPRILIDRPKTGFSVPLGAWLRGPLRNWAEDLLSPEALATDRLINPVPIRAAWADHLSGNVDRSAQLWIILMFQAWRLEHR